MRNAPTKTSVSADCSSCSSVHCTNTIYQPLFLPHVSGMCSSFIRSRGQLTEAIVIRLTQISWKTPILRLDLSCLWILATRIDRSPWVNSFAHELIGIPYFSDSHCCYFCYLKNGGAENGIVCMEKYQYRYSMWSSFAFQDSGRQADERERENKEYRRKDKVISDCGLPLPTLTRVRRFASTLDFTLRLLLVFCPRRKCALRYHRESFTISSSITRCVVVGRWNAEGEME
jgi:hypothetical protein